MPSEGEISAAALALARSLEPGLRQAFLQAVARLRLGVTPAQLLALIESGNVEAVVNAVLPPGKVEEAWRAVTAEAVRIVVSTATAFAAGAEPLQAPVVGRMEVRFSVTNPGTTRWLQGYETMMLQGFSTATRQAVTQAIRSGMQAGQNPLNTARAIPRAIGLTAQLEVAAQNYERALREGRMTDAARYALRDRRLGHRMAPADEDRIQRMVERYRERALALRAQTIARTESIRAANAGNYLLWEQQVGEGKVREEQVRRKWVYTADSKVRHAHRGIPSLNPQGVGMKEPFRSELGPIMFPGDINASAANTVNCRCTVIYRINSRPSGIGKPK